MLANMTHRTKLHSTNPIERLNGEIKRALRWSASSPMKMPSNGRSSAPVTSITPLSDDPAVSFAAAIAS